MTTAIGQLLIMDRIEYMPSFCCYTEIHEYASKELRKLQECDILQHGNELLLYCIKHAGVLAEITAHWTFGIYQGATACLTLSDWMASFQ